MPVWLAHPIGILLEAKEMHQDQKTEHFQEKC
ncbi:hypothetical protein GGD46_002705 [Rhizobium lusitanum]|uniref:Uncharacterized protein n=1 Tax=Rhizobium lusitanum TaxID=293958 RepID=A0A7X0ISZ7_9HYPH|nr:hypothetical protein [Rhizobium lusitanum]